MTPILAARDLTVGYRIRGASREVLRHVSVDLSPGELICLLGPNGAGKTTLLRTLTGMRRPLAGRVTLDARPLVGHTPADVARRVAVVLSERVEASGLSVRRTVELGRYPHCGWLGRLGARDHAAVDRALERCDVMALASRELASLSDGERQRVLIARALAQEPAVLVLDEPTAFLDVSARAGLMGWLRQVTRDDGLAVVASTHDIELALRSADLIWLARRSGDVVAGAPEDLVAAGAIGDVFDSGSMCFDSAERLFRPVRRADRRAALRGDGMAVALGRAVLEREGYDVVSQATQDVAVTVTAEARSWQLSAGALHVDGVGYRSLAMRLREVSGERQWKGNA